MQSEKFQRLLKDLRKKFHARLRHPSFPGKSSGIELRCTKSPDLPARIKAFALRIEQGKFTSRWPLTHKSHNRGGFAISDQRQGGGSALRSGVPLIGQAGAGKEERGMGVRGSAALRSGVPLIGQVGTRSDGKEADGQKKPQDVPFDAF